jgi:hypothetical protein
MVVEEVVLHALITSRGIYLSFLRHSNLLVSLDLSTSVSDNALLKGKIEDSNTYRSIFEKFKI